MDIDSAQPGTSLFHRSLTISWEAVAAYLTAVEDNGAVYAAEGIAPPLAVAALVMAQALDAIDLPAGTVHTSQEVEFTAPIPTGAAIACSATVAQNSVRRGTRFVALDIVAEADGRCAVAGRVSLAIPEPEAAG